MKLWNEKTNNFRIGHKFKIQIIVVKKKMEVICNITSLEMNSSTIQNKFPK